MGSLPPAAPPEHTEACHRMVLQASRWYCRYRYCQISHLEDGRCLQHLSHERGQPPLLAVASTHTSKQRVPQRDAGGSRGHKAAGRQCG
jgi:hypothetical protein